MVCINWTKKPYTFHYSQPESYSFSLDSIELPWRISNRYTGRDLSESRVMDLCAGCGVIGFEFRYWNKTVRQVDFVEVQSGYREHFDKNLETTEGDSNLLRFVNQNLVELAQSPEFESSHDIIFCNPPYFRKEMGSLTPNKFRNRCKFLLDCSFEQLVAFILRCLKPGGECYILLRDLSVNGINQEAELRKLCTNVATVEELESVRGTPVFRIEKKIRN